MSDTQSVRVWHRKTVDEIVTYGISPHTGALIVDIPWYLEDTKIHGVRMEPGASATLTFVTDDVVRFQYFPPRGEPETVLTDDTPPPELSSEVEAVEGFHGGAQVVEVVPLLTPREALAAWGIDMP